MKMKNIFHKWLWGTAFAAATCTAFDSNAQDVAQSSDQITAAQENAPVALMLISDMSHADSLEYRASSFFTHNNRMQNALIDKGYETVRFGTGFETFPVDDIFELDSTLSIMKSNHKNDLLYINAHGTVYNDAHYIEYGSSVSRTQQGEETTYNILKKSADLIKRMIDKSREDGNSLSIIFDSCAGDQLIEDLADVELPIGTQILTGSQRDDVSFSNTITDGFRASSFKANQQDVMRLYQAANGHIFDDQDNPAKYKMAPSGVTRLRVNEKGEKVISCVRREIQERIGIGFSDSEKRQILENYRSVDIINRRAADQYKDKPEQIDYADSILKKAKVFEHIKHNEMIPIFLWTAFLPTKEMSIDEYRLFTKQESERRVELGKIQNESAPVPTGLRP